MELPPRTRALPGERGSDSRLAPLTVCLLDEDLRVLDGYPLKTPMRVNHCLHRLVIPCQVEWIDVYDRPPDPTIPDDEHFHEFEPVRQIGEITFFVRTWRCPRGCLSTYEMNERQREDRIWAGLSPEERREVFLENLRDIIGRLTMHSHSWSPTDKRKLAQLQIQVFGRVLIETKQ